MRKMVMQVLQIYLAVLETSRYLIWKIGCSGNGQLQHRWYSHPHDNYNIGGTVIPIMKN
ncbi:MAG: hypothetical protein ABFC12_04895 [Methanobacterium sp.]